MIGLPVNAAYPIDLNRKPLVVMATKPVFLLAGRQEEAQY